MEDRIIFLRNNLRKIAMDISTKHDPKTWLKDVGYPCIRIINPETYE
jgi:hypothetical protein